GPGNSSGCIQGRTVCPHSPATPLRPFSTRPSTAMPPPQPVPKMTAKTTCWPAPAPSVASETARQLASFAQRTSRCSASPRSRSNGLPIIHTELAFFTAWVIREIELGMPTPTVALRCSSRSNEFLDALTPCLQHVPSLFGNCADEKLWEDRLTSRGIVFVRRIC